MWSLNVAMFPTAPTKLKPCPPKVSGTHNGGILYLMLGCFGGGKTPLHKAVSTQLTLGEDSSIFGT